MKCVRCNETGSIPESQGKKPILFKPPNPLLGNCPNCGGTGAVACDRCNGKGVVPDFEF